VLWFSAARTRLVWWPVGTGRLESGEDARAGNA
jgi:hypothetical protein